MKILVAGATGLVGTALLPALQAAGHTPIRLARPGHAAPAAAGHGFDVQWNPMTGELGGAAVGADAVVNLAGASIADGRWTEKRKQELRASRIDSTRALVAALSRMAARPRVLVSSSAIGFYGDRGDEILTEESSGRTDDFLGTLAAEWEAEARKAEALGIRVVLARFAVVLARQGGALPVMARPFRLGVGGRLGSGRQWMSWIALDDVVRILQLAIENESVRGPVNLASPQPVRNAEFTQSLARALHRPTLFPAPAFALRLALGKEKAEGFLLGSTRVQPAVLERLGFRFQHAMLDETLRNLLA